MPDTHQVGLVDDQASPGLTDKLQGRRHASPMAYPRSHTVHPGAPGFYLCTSRCVRRAWLCGQDPLTGLSFNHRRAWIEHRLVELADLFAIDLFGFAVMSNHYHVVLKTDPERACTWSDEAVAERWLRLCPVKDEQERALRLTAIVHDEARLAELRRRLASLSWFMKFINEPISRRSNKEEGCTGRFWEGRFHASALLDEAAVATAMTYVDLNPVRAGVVDDPAQAEHTALRRRLNAPEGDNRGLAPLEAIGMTLGAYHALIQWTMRCERNRGGRLPPGVPRILHCTPQDWLTRLRLHRGKPRVHGALGAMRAFADQMGQLWVKGCGQAPAT
jgi:hypothetical protein